MKIAVLGYGKEGRSTEKFFAERGDDVTVFSQLNRDELLHFPTEQYDLVFRSPSIPPVQPWASQTQYFFEHSPAPIIGVTGTKGKGTTCTLIAHILRALGYDVHLVGNIGYPALDSLAQLRADSVVVYELSSFQLWDLTCSPQIAVVLRVEADHLDVHSSLAEYIAAKSHIASFQTTQDTCIYYGANPASTQIAQMSPGKLIAYPTALVSQLEQQILDQLSVVGAHNRENAMAAFQAVASFLQLPKLEFLQQYRESLISVMQTFKPLPHHLELVRELNHVGYYDDSFSTALPALEAALAAFDQRPLVLLLGGKDKGVDLTPIIAAVNRTSTIHQVILIGELAARLAPLLSQPYQIAGSDFARAIQLARVAAEAVATHQLPAVVVLSPATSSFDMFENYYARGEAFARLVKAL